MAAAVSEMAKPPTILSSVDRSARNVAAETATGPLDAVIDVIFGSALNAPRF